MTSKGALDRAVQLTLATAVVAMATAVVYSELRPQATTTVARARQPEYIENWRALLPYARRLGDSAAPIQLIEFMDLECPACRLFSQVILPRLSQSYGEEIAVNFVHLPLLNVHRFADQAATASECAARDGRFAPFTDLVLRRQDSVGLKSWASFAREAGVRDTVSFWQCLKRGRAPLVDSGIALSARLGVNATPTVILNGWRVPNVTEEEVRRVIAAIRQQRDPYNVYERRKELVRSP